MSVYERLSYAPKSTIGHTVSTTPTLSTKQRHLSFATEWYWYPEGIKAVADRFNKVLADNDLIADHNWDETFNRFRLRCRTQDSRIVAEEFRNVLATIIKEELKKGYKETWVDHDDEPADEVDKHYRKLLEDLGPEDQEEISDDEIEALELDVEESLGSRLIRRLNLHEDEVRAGAQLNAATNSDIQDSVVGDEYPASTRSHEFKAEWLDYFQAPLELDKVFPDDCLVELKDLTGCEFSKCMRSGILYIGCDVESGLQDAQRKLANIKLISQLSGPYFRNIFYTEGLDVAKFVLQFITSIKKEYFATTLLDNLRLSVNSDDRQDGQLLPAWEKLCNGVTVRTARLDVNTDMYKAVKNVELSEIPTVDGASFKDWDGFKYSSRNESSYLRRYVDPKTGCLVQRLKRPIVTSGAPTASVMPRSIPLNAVGPVQNTMPRSASLNTIEQRQNAALKDGGGLPQLNGDTQKAMRIQQWQEEVETSRQEGSVVENRDDESKTPGFSRAENHVEPPAAVAWDTYQEITIDSIRRKKMESTSLNVSKGVAKGSAALYHRSPGSALAAKREVPTARQFTSEAPSVAPRLSREHLLEKAAQTSETVDRPAQADQHPLSDVTNLPPTDQNQDADFLINLDAIEGSLVVQPPAILDDDVSMVHGSILQPFRPGDAHSLSGLSLHLQAAQESTELSEDEDLICLTPPNEQDVLVTSRTTPASMERDSLDPDNLQEKLQIKDEVSSRAFHITMKQKAGKGKQKGVKSTTSKAILPLPSPPRPKVQKVKEQVEDPSHYFINDITKNFTELVDSIRFFQGNLVIQVEFGRIILEDCPERLIWRETGNKVFEHNALRNNLIGQRQHTSFTKVLSLVPQEMEYLIGMKNRDGKSMWQPSSVQPPRWEVSYEFHYRDLKALDSPFFVVKIDGETFKSEVFVRKDLGEINVHGVVRHWDYRIAVTGHQSIKPTDSKAHDVHRSIEKSLHVPPEAEVPRLLWEMENSLIERFQLVELVVKRVKKYAGYTVSGYGGSELNITEYQSLEVEVLEVPERVSCVYMASPSPYDRHPTEKLTKWWEASISSVRLDKMLVENEKLALGDEATWATAPLDESIAPSLFLPACVMLKQMDGVGQQNKNGIIRKEIPIPPKTKKPSPQEEIGFW